MDCVYVLGWTGADLAAVDVRQLVPCDTAPANLGSGVAVLDVTPAEQLDSSSRHDAPRIPNSGCISCPAERPRSSRCAA